MFGLGFWEISVILIIALVVLGPKKLPEMAKSLGKGIREFRSATEDFKSTLDSEMSRPAPKELPRAPAAPAAPVDEVIAEVEPAPKPTPATEPAPEPAAKPSDEETNVVASAPEGQDDDSRKPDTVRHQAS